MRYLRVLLGDDVDKVIDLIQPEADDDTIRRIFVKIAAICSERNNTLYYLGLDEEEAGIKEQAWFVRTGEPIKAVFVFRVQFMHPDVESDNVSSEEMLKHFDKFTASSKLQDRLKIHSWRRELAKNVEDNACRIYRTDDDVIFIAGAFTLWLTIRVIEVRLQAVITYESATDLSSIEKQAGKTTQWKAWRIATTFVNLVPPEAKKNAEDIREWLVKTCGENDSVTMYQFENHTTFHDENSGRAVTMAIRALL
jgi:hypothetical protein